MASRQTSWSPQARWRLRVYPLALLGALVAALVFSAVRYDRADATSRLGGDYPSFYAAGAIARSGDWDELYQAERQQAEQAGLIDDAGGFLYFAYPPFVAGAYAGLAGIGYKWSFLLQALLMAAALVAAIAVLRPWLRRLGLPVAALLVLALACYPILRAVTGGQNTTLTILLVAGAARLDHEDRPLLAGMILSLALFKPQFGVLLALPVLAGRRWRVLAGWAGGGLALYAVSVLLTGGEWAAAWWRQAGAFREQNLRANGENFVSLPGFLANAAGSAGEVAGVILGIVVLAAVMYFWWTFPRELALERYALAILAVVLLAPQTLYYDAGVAVLALAVVVGGVGSRPLALIGATLLAASWTELAAPVLGWSPLGPLLWLAAAGFGWMVTARWRQPTPV